VVNDVNGIHTRQTSSSRESAGSGQVRERNTSKADSSEPRQSADVVVELSQSAQLEAAVKQLASEPAVDSNKVAEVREQLRNGSYQLDPERIAQKLVAQDFEF